jgi:hypothetical protein
LAESGELIAPISSDISSISPNSDGQGKAQKRLEAMGWHTADVERVSRDVVLGLSRHGYPFSGLLRSLSESGMLERLTLSPSDEEFLKVQNRSVESLSATLRTIREEMERVLEQLGV